MTAVILLTAALLSYGMYPAAPTYTQSYSPVVNPGYEIIETPAVGSVTIAGNVSRPGEYKFYSGMLVSDLIGEAGSFLNGADYESINLIRATPYGDTAYLLSWHISWQRLISLKPGDTVIIPAKTRMGY
ncbi:MAG: SLBB domain-containing protein [Armatimonadota bacterium]|nr:SLBB domain-containing protein [Armatimonadota bacterium]